MDSESKQSIYARLFGGIFSTLEEYPGTTSSPMYSRAVKMLDKYMEKGLDHKVLDKELLNWINSPVLDSLKDHASFSRICGYGHFELVRWFAEKFPEKVQNHQSNFLSACYSGNIALLEWILEKYPVDVHFKKEQPLKILCNLGKLEPLKWFLEKYPETDVHISTEEPFWMLCHAGDLESVKWFLTEYPETNVYQEWNNGFHIACLKNRQELVRWFLTKYQYLWSEEAPTVVADLCETGNLELVKMILEMCPENLLNIFDIQSDFESACIHGYLETAEWFYSQYRNDIRKPDDNVFEECVKRSNFSTLFWLHETFPN